MTVLTGGAGGMALACARRLAAGGRKARPVVLADLPGDRLDAAVAGLRAEGIDAEAAPCDVSDGAAVAVLADRAAARGRFGVLVHTAGLAPPLASDPRAILEVNLAGTARVLDVFEPLLQPGSVAVCIASMGGYRRSAARHDELLAEPLAPGLLDRLGAETGNPLAAYALSKRGVILECRRRAAAWGRQGARIVSVSPGLIADTAIGAAASTIHAGAYADQAALRRAGSTADVAGVVAFLASPDAAYVTGCDVLVDGGVLADMAHHQDERTRAAWHGFGD